MVSYENIEATPELMLGSATQSEALYPGFTSTNLPQEATYTTSAIRQGDEINLDELDRVGQKFSEQHPLPPADSNLPTIEADISDPLGVTLVLGGTAVMLGLFKCAENLNFFRRFRK